MATATDPTTIADLLDGLGGIPAGRVLLRPTPGTATERDLIQAHARNRRLYELVDGTLVEKAVGFEESRLTALLIGYLVNYLERHDLGAVVGPDTFMRLFPGLVRAPDVAFVSWRLHPRSQGHRGEIPTVVPDLAVEILSKRNTRKEMKRKLEEYFRAGVRLVWYVDPAKRTVTVYTAPDRATVLGEGDTLDGGEVLPGFALAIGDWFAEARRTGPRDR